MIMVHIKLLRYEAKMIIDNLLYVKIRNDHCQN